MKEETVSLQSFDKLLDKLKKLMSQKRFELFQDEDVLNDEKVFESYISEILPYNWFTETKTTDNDDVIVLLAKHFDRDYDAIIDCYKFFVWMKSRGFGKTNTYRTGLRHPKGKYYGVDIRLNKDIFTVKTLFPNQNFINIRAVVYSAMTSYRGGVSHQPWSESHKFCIEL